MKPELKVSVEIVAEVTPSRKAQRLIERVARKAGCLDDYKAYHYYNHSGICVSVLGNLEVLEQ